VKREVQTALAHTRLIPLKLEDCDLPKEFAELHTLRFETWPRTIPAIRKAVGITSPWTAESDHYIFNTDKKFPFGDEIV
jgi:hypothetical protein